MRYISQPVTYLEQNCSILWCESTHQTVIIDPGGDVEVLVAKIAAQRLVPVLICLTHGHIDHVGGAVALAQEYQIPIHGPHRNDAYWFEALDQQAHWFGFPEEAPFEPDHWLEEGDRIVFGEESLEVLLTPGHTPGHLVYYHCDSSVVFVGDVLFKGAVGRSDFPGGNQQQLLDSIRDKLWPLDNKTRVVAGHGPETSIGEERATNPFLR